MAKNYQILRKKYPKFVFEKYFWRISGRDLKISFHFRIIPRIKFNPQIVIKDIPKKGIDRIGERTLNNLVFNLGLIEVLSYWKATCSPEIEIKAGNLRKDQINWWYDLIINGMGQFFYENKIDFKKPDFLKITTINEAGSRSKLYEAGSRNDRVLVPIGGGKDSVVTLEILKRARNDYYFKNISITCFALNPTRPIKKIMKIARCKNQVIVERKIDKKLLELNERGFLNGHTPFSAYLAFLSVLVAVLFDQKYITFSNERSSNEGNLKYLGRTINHQYSKSFDFEKKFRKYSTKYLTSGVEYFSFLRPLYEIQVAKLFSKYQKYFPHFVSCNVAFQTNSGRRKPLGRWCNKCPKCLFVFASLFPFLGEYRLVKIFKENLFKKISLLPTMLRLIGEKDFKPFECIGTKKESQIAFYLSLSRLKRRRTKLPFLLKHFETQILPKYSKPAPYRVRSGAGLEKEAENLMNSWNRNHFLPKEFERILRANLKSRQK